MRYPYSPSLGRRPGALVGRYAQLAEWDTALQRVETGRAAQPGAFPPEATGVTGRLWRDAIAELIARHLRTYCRFRGQV